MNSDIKEHCEHATPHGLSSTEGAMLQRLVKLWMLAKIKFSKAVKKEELAYPVAGSQWKLKNETPWPRETDPVITVLDAHSGWVRYKIGRSEIFSDDRLRLESFLHCYRQI